MESCLLQIRVTADVTIELTEDSKENLKQRITSLSDKLGLNLFKIDLLDNQCEEVEANVDDFEVELIEVIEKEDC